MRRVLATLLLLAPLATVASAAVPRVPHVGVIVPGKSFAGMPLGLTPLQVRARWGKRYGVCDNCAEQTWYFTFKKFAPQAIAVRFENSRVAAYFTVGKPAGWRTKEGLTIGDQTIRIEKIYGNAPVIDCAGYSLKQILVKGELLLFFLDTTVDKDTVYGIGLANRSFNPCR